jgi:hypothetical protein
MSEFRPLADGWYLHDTGYACGGVRLRDGKVVEAAPIFQKMRGWSPKQVANAMRGKAVRVYDAKKEAEDAG